MALRPMTILTPCPWLAKDLKRRLSRLETRDQSYFRPVARIQSGCNLNSYYLNQHSVYNLDLGVDLRRRALLLAGCQPALGTPGERSAHAEQITTNAWIPAQLGRTLGPGMRRGAPEAGPDRGGARHLVCTVFGIGRRPSFVVVLVSIIIPITS